MTSSKLARILILPVDLAGMVLVAVPGLLIILFQSVLSRGLRDPRRVMSIATAPLFVAVGDDIGGFSTYYVYPGARLSVAVFLDGSRSERFVGRSLPSLIGLTLVDGIPHILRKILPLTSIAVHEIVSVGRIIALASKLRIGTLATLSPSRMTPRATLAAVLLGASFVVKVFGNQMLLAHIKGPRHPTLLQSLAAWMKAVMTTMLAQAVYRRADLVIGYNINNAASAISLGAHPARTRMLRIRPHAATFAIEPARGRMNDQIVLWSRLASEKATFEACAAAIRVLERNPGATLLVIGDGPERPRLEILAQASPVLNRIKFSGWMQRDELLKSVNGSAVALVPLGGYALLEAAMLGVPIVCFDIEWHNEVITHGVSGYLADYPDVDHMAELIESIMSDPDKAKRFSDAARLRVESIFEPAQRMKDEERIMYSFFRDAEKRV